MESLSSLSAIMMDAAVRATVLLALAWAACMLLKRRSAATRHTVRAFVLGSLVLLPFSALLPAWHIKGIPEFAPASSLRPRAETPKPAPAARSKAASTQDFTVEVRGQARERAVNSRKRVTRTEAAKSQTVYVL